MKDNIKQELLVVGVDISKKELETTTITIMAVGE